MKRLSVFSSKLFRRTARGLETTGGFVVQMDALAPYFAEIVLCVPVVDNLAFQGIGVTVSNISFHPLPYWHGKAGFFRMLPHTSREIRRTIQRTDLGLVIVPGYVGAWASLLCQRHRLPIFHWVVGDWGKNTLLSQRNRLARWAASVVLTPFLDRMMARLTRDTLTFFNGRILYDQNKASHYTRFSSSISQRTFYTRNASVPLRPPYRLLFVGRLAPEKGISHLLGATKELIASGNPVELHVVGEGSLETDLRNQVKALSLTDRVFFHGFVPQGEALRRFYRESDVFILPSLYDQQPKVLLEAMAHSLPIVATSVGGTPSLIQNGHNGLLVPPARPEAIATAICRILTDGDLRQQFVENGLAYARLHTVELETRQMMQIIACHFNFELPNE